MEEAGFTIVVPGACPPVIYIYIYIYILFKYVYVALGHSLFVGVVGRNKSVGESG